MHARSLFTKIFLWFWLATILVIVAMAGSVHTLANPEKALTRVFRDTAQTAHGKVAAEILEESGQAGLREHFRRLHRHGDIPSFLFNERGEEMAGQDITSDVAEVAVQVAKMTKVTVKPHEDSLLIGSPVTGPSGRRYVFVVNLPPMPKRGIPGPLGLLLSEPDTLALIIIVLVMTSGVLCYGLARYLSAPLQRLRDVTCTIATGTLDARVDKSVSNRKDEIGDLGRDFNNMAERIDVLVTSQRRLLRDISHELRSPLARLSVALGIARQHSNSAGNEPLDRIELETVRLNELIGQLLTLTRLEGGADGVIRDRVQLENIMRQITEDADYEARSRRRRVRLTKCEPCVTTGSPELLRRAIENVVRNAVWYTAEDTEVEVELCHQPQGMPGSAKITVRDHGKGIPESELSNIFRPFHRTEEARERDTGGAGLGLSISERAVRTHGGSVEARNAPGGGLIVEICLPLVER